VKTPATASFAVSVSGSVPVSGDENDILLCYAGSIPLVYSRILSEFTYWRSELYKNDGCVSVICAVSYNTERHYPESVRFRVESASGDAVRREYVDIGAFKK
jgi:hypothetical protein